MNPITSVVIALLAGAFAGFAGSQFAATPEAAPRVESAGDLSRRLDALEVQLTALVAAAAVPAPAVVEGGASIEAKREPLVLVDAEARRRLELLEQAFTQLRTGAPGASPQPGTGVVDAGVPAAKKTVAERKHALLTAVTETDKLGEWRELRFEPDSYDDAVVAAMVQVGLSSKDPLVRADVWRQADGSSSHAALAPALVQALQVDGDSRVREEAAETLVKYLDVPGVREALTAAMQSDADAKVRRQAGRTLEPRSR